MNVDVFYDCRTERQGEDRGKISVNAFIIIMLVSSSSRPG